MSIERGENLEKYAEKKPENVVELETENARYRIVYNRHDTELSPETVRGSDGIILELLKVNEENADELVLRPPEVVKNLYGKIFDEALESGTPIYLADLNSQFFESGEFIKDDKRHFDLVALEGAIAVYLGANVGIAVLSEAGKRLKQKKDGMSRRKFLGLLGKSVGAAYLSTPGLEVLSDKSFSRSGGSHPDESSVHRQVGRHLKKVNRKIHPETKTPLIDGRNYLYAQKSETIAKNIFEKTGRKPELALVVGLAHTGVEDALVMSEDERIKELKHYFGDTLADDSLIFQVNQQIDESGEKRAEVISMRDRVIADGLK